MYIMRTSPTKRTHLWGLGASSPVQWCTYTMINLPLRTWRIFDTLRYLLHYIMIHYVVNTCKCTLLPSFTTWGHKVHTFLPSKAGITWMACIGKLRPNHQHTAYISALCRAGNNFSLPSCRTHRLHPTPICLPRPSPGDVMDHLRSWSEIPSWSFHPVLIISEIISMSTLRSSNVATGNPFWRCGFFMATLDYRSITRG